MLNFKTLILIFISVFLLTSCQSVKETLSMKKKNNTNEFLVNKKNPLTMPPDFEKLPKPSDEEIIEDENNEQKKINFSKVLKKSKIKSKNQNTNLEKSVSDILNSNENF